MTKFISPMKKNLLDLPTPSNISIMWNFGSLAGFFLASQILTGLFLAMFYTSDISTAFQSIDQISRNVTAGWFVRLLHTNGASFMFLCLYCHMGRSIYYGFFLKSNHTWESGIMIFILSMAAAFFGYILPWGQMSFWGATVITSLFSAIPFFGPMMVQWIWGGFSVDCPTLTRFFALHFLVPFLIFTLMMIHLVCLHTQGSGSGLKLTPSHDKIMFHIYFSIKDVGGILILFLILITINLMTPYTLMEPDNFMPANPLVTPTHIQPEWYFLFAYAILRAVPNKLGGVIALVMSLLILFMLPKISYIKFKKSLGNLLMKIMFWWFANIFLILTWIGMCPVEAPYEMIGKISSLLYFSFFLIIMNI